MESEPGKGSGFDVIPPRVEEEAVEKSGEKKSRPRGKGRILFIDDEEGVVIAYSEALKRLGYLVTSFTKPEQALEAFTKGPEQFDLAIIDMTMPGIPGDKLAEKFIRTGRDIKIIICSGSSELITEEEARKLGINGYILKPIAIGELDRIIRKVLYDQ